MPSHQERVRRFNDGANITHQTSRDRTDAEISESAKRMIEKYSKAFERLGKTHAELELELRSTILNKEQKPFVQVSTCDQCGDELTGMSFKTIENERICYACMNYNRNDI